MRLPSRRTLWLSSIPILIVVGAWFLAPRSRVTQANFYKIKRDMSKEAVKAILGDSAQTLFGPDSILEGDDPMAYVLLRWSDGPNWIEIHFANDEVVQRYSHIATAWETLKWHAARFGVTWP